VENEKGRTDPKKKRGMISEKGGKWPIVGNDVRMCKNCCSVVLLVWR